MRRPPEVYSPSEVERLLAVCGRGVTGRRNRALIVLLWRTGLRVSEALALHLPDLDAQKGTVTVRWGKGGKYRVVGMDQTAFALMENWLDYRRKLGLRGSPVFCTLRGASMDPAYVRQLLPRLGRRAGLERRIHAHGLRHTCASELALEGKPLVVISAQLGHSNPVTTTRYLAKIAPAQLVAAMRDRKHE